MNRAGQIVAEATTSEEANRLAAQQQPDVVVLDLALPDAAGRIVYDGIRLAAPATRFIIFTAHESEHRFYTQQGVTFIAKIDRPAALVAALNAS